VLVAEIYDELAAIMKSFKDLADGLGVEVGAAEE
jgi:hypothetical protein